MTPDSNPFIILNRLIVVTHSGNMAYDEKFHTGVNIIRGKNSSGKSTIANFIFYVLGGDYHNWTSEARKCEEVIAEVEINDAILTLKRKITESGLQSMSIFWGTYEEARMSNLNWKTFPYKQTENVISFTHVIFKALGFPEVRSDSDSNLTMHQILRLIYIDQDSPTQNLFRFERFDLPLTRQAISELLLGIYEDNLYNERLSLRAALKDQEEKKRQFDGVSHILVRSGNATSYDEIDKRIAEATHDKSEVDRMIDDLRTKEKLHTSIKTVLVDEKIQDSLIAAKNEIRNIISSIDQYEVDIMDSRQFVTTLEKRVSELNNSLTTRKILGELPLTHCPQCLNTLDGHHDENHCYLCKQQLPEETEKSHAKRLLQEMELQIKESKSLLFAKENTLSEFKSLLPAQKQKARSLQQQLDKSVNLGQTTRDSRLDQLLIEKGTIEQRISFLHDQIKAIGELEALGYALSELAAKIERLRRSISLHEEKLHTRYTIAMQKIREFTKEILERDLDRQAEFKKGRQVDIDFMKDSYSLDGSNNFSASSKTYFKNAVLFSIFFASVELDFFRYPRFILCDNIEDKGMEKERSQNFQDVIVDISGRLKNKHQIIFTTSMVAEDLDNTPLCIGNEYDQNNKTLKL